MDNKKMIHPALTEFALQSAKDWEAVANERLGVIERLCAEVEALRAMKRECTPVFSMILQALDRDAAEGRAIRGEMAAELRSLLARCGQ